MGDRAAGALSILVLFFNAVWGVATSVTLKVA